MKYSAKGNNYKHGDDVKYIIFNMENPYLQDLHKSIIIIIIIIIIMVLGTSHIIWKVLQCET